MTERSQLFQNGADGDHVDHSQKQARNLPYLFIWALVWFFCLSIGYFIYTRYGNEPWFGISTVSPTYFRFMADYALVLIVLLLAVAFTGATEIWSTPGAYFDPSPIETTLMMNQLITRYINYVGPLLGIPIAICYFVLDLVL